MATTDERTGANGTATAPYLNVTVERTRNVDLDLALYGVPDSMAQDMWEFLGSYPYLESDVYAYGHYQRTFGGMRVIFDRQRTENTVLITVYGVRPVDGVRWSVRLKRALDLLVWIRGLTGL